MAEPEVMLSAEERSMICSCLMGWLGSDHNPRVKAMVISALRKLEGVDNQVIVRKLVTRRR